MSEPECTKEHIEFVEYLKSLPKGKSLGVIAYELHLKLSVAESAIALVLETENTGRSDRMFEMKPALRKALACIRGEK